VQREHGFQFHVRVFDGTFHATTRVHLQLKDENDEKPVFDGGNEATKKVQFHEAVPLRHLVAQLHATDADQGDSIE
jgi:hypothetical protein